MTTQKPWIPHLQFISSRIDPGADDLEQVTVTQGNLRQWHDVIEEMFGALHAVYHDNQSGSLLTQTQNAVVNAIRNAGCNTQ